MLALDFWFLMIAGPAVIFAGISKGGFGSGASFAGAAILAIVLDPGIALALMLPLLMLIDVASLRSYWGQWHFPSSVALILGSLPGVALGAWFLSTADPDVFRVLIGVIALGFVAWQFRHVVLPVTEERRPWPTGIGAVFGMIAGFTSFVSHAGGPPAAIFLLRQNLSKTEYQASTVLVFWIINIFKFVPYAGLGLFTRDIGIATIVLAPFAFLGTWMGIKLHHLIPEKAFFTLTYILLVMTGVKLIWDGLS